MKLWRVKNRTNEWNQWIQRKHFQSAKKLQFIIFYEHAAFNTEGRNTNIFADIYIKLFPHSFNYNLLILSIFLGIFWGEGWFLGFQRKCEEMYCFGVLLCCILIAGFLGVLRAAEYFQLSCQVVWDFEWFIRNRDRYWKFYLKIRYLFV